MSRHSANPVSVHEGDRVANTRMHDPDVNLTGVVLSVKGRKAEVRIERAVRRDGGAPIPPGDPWRSPGSVVRCAAFYWRGL